VSFVAFVGFVCFVAFVAFVACVEFVDFVDFADFVIIVPRHQEQSTSTGEMSDTGTWGLRDPKEATAEQGRADTERFVNAAVQFIARWRQLRP
jgi:creatinine amidohydrolase/Fe(II)-dependent formamide hydrolase-like protein